MGGGFSYLHAEPENGNRLEKSFRRQYIDQVLINGVKDIRCKCLDPGEGEEKKDEFSSKDLQEYADLFPFENLVFGGGGAKGIAYPGALQVLEEVGVLKRIKRCAGTSSGSFVALMISLGYTAEEIRKVARMDFRVFFDASFGWLSFLSNLLRFFGWHPMNSLYDFFGEIVEKKLGNKDATFNDLYNKTGMELCVVVTNLTNMEEEYFHPKTTPDVALRLAIRMSISIPGLMQPVTFKRRGKDCIYADGGILMNKPISCFDGWWLSMGKADTFFNRLQSLENLPTFLDRKNRFARDERTAHKTLGFVLVDDTGYCKYHLSLCDTRSTNVVFPDTPLARKALLDERKVTKLDYEQQGLKRSISKLLGLASKYDIDNDGLISKDEFREIFQDESFTSEEKATLFGNNATVKTAMHLLDKDSDGMISFKEVIEYCEDIGYAILDHSSGLNRQEMNSLKDYITSVFTTMYVNLDHLGFSADDSSRIVGLNTHYVTTTDFGLEPEDAEFLDKVAYESTLTFLRRFAATKLVHKENTSCV
uniref:Uncharacterized protein LOC111123502 n=1 Tax=Crassostrea virginica TaxID=6565 RepID=A0A8B8D0J3_CRAVI|nr:uncharacterized protein LOC111123502 [Crassostrea virginica]